MQPLRVMFDLNLGRSGGCQNVTVPTKQGTSKAFYLERLSLFLVNKLETNNDTSFYEALQKSQRGGGGGEGEEGVREED